MTPSHHFFPLVLCRAAALSYGTAKSKNAESLLQTPYFRSALFLASKVLYSELKKKDFQYKRLSEKERLTVEKYANRLINRSTPFGAFAGFCPVSLSGNGEQVVIADDIRLHLQPDFRHVLALYNKALEQIQAKSTLRTNPSAYPTPRSVRYIHYREDEKGSRHFSIRQVENNAMVSRLILFCRNKRTGREIHTFLTDTLGLETEAAEDFLHELISLQLLEHTLQPHITGEGLYQRLMGQPGPKGSAPDPVFAAPMDKNQFFTLPVKSIATPADSNGYYANLEFSAAGGLPSRVSDQLQDALYALRKTSTSADPPALTDFACDLHARFGSRAVPLMTALDPELGVSYGRLAQAGEIPPLLRGIPFAETGTVEQTVPWGPLQQLLINKWPADKSKGITLTGTDLDNLPGSDRKLPPSFSLPFRVADGQLVAEAGGGNSALAILGRFTSFNTQLLEKARTVAATEQAQNQEVIFAEIACITDSHTDNINRREQLREYEIPIRTGSLAPDNRQISLADLRISVTGGRICLWSSKLSKRIIPRLSSAYNFQRSDLPVFRLLGDLQYQDLQHSLVIAPEILFPNLDYYPRITYRNCVLAEASWRFSKNILHEAPFEDQYEVFKTWAQDAGLPRLFAIARHDQYLVFDQSAPDSIRLFLSEARRTDNILLKEVFRESARGGTVVNPQGETLASQFIATILSDTPAYPDKIEKPPLRTEKKTKTNFLPGSEWLYYKVYCLPVNSDYILRATSRLATALLRQKKISQWFFVRYLDPEPHLRIRLMTGEIPAGELINYFSTLFKDLEKKGFARKIQIDTYERETERYAAGPVTRVEQIFHLSSALALRWPKKPGRETTAYRPALRVAYDTILLFVPHPAERLAFIKALRDNLQHEDSRAMGLKNSLESKKRAFKNEVYQLLQDKDFYSSCGLSGAAGKYLAAIRGIVARHQEPPLQLLADLIHMHINRAFSTDMRRQEMVIYTLLYQYELTVQKRRD